MTRWQSWAIGSRRPLRSTHPEDGKAFLERGGAHWQLGHRAEAGADATRACDLGVSEGCARVKMVR